MCAHAGSLSLGDQEAIIAIPVIHNIETVNVTKPFTKDGKTVTQTIIVRRMPKENYHKHYAKGANIN